MVLIKSNIKPGEITGLTIWSANQFFTMVNCDELDQSRIGPWLEEMLEGKFQWRVAEIRAGIPVFCLPSYQYLTAFKSKPKTLLLGGVVSWRALLSRYVDEDAFIEQTHIDGTRANLFVKQTEVGAFQNSVACYANLDDVYKIIFSNVEPVFWAQLDLNKAGRISTNIGEFSMVYFSNAKWFKFEPSDNGIPAGVYEQELELLLKYGHTFDIHKFNLIIDSKIIGSWSLDLVEGQTNGQRTFSKAVEDDILALAEDDDQVVNGNSDAQDRMTQARKRNVFFGGAATKKTEYVVSRILANVIHNAVWSVGKQLINLEDDNTWYEKTLGDVFKGTNCPVELLNAVQTDLLAVKKFSEVCAMAATSTEILSVLLSAANVDAHISRATVRLGLACSMAFGELADNLSLLEWNLEQLNRLNVKTWLV